ncbi:family 78 glycoside hydrolase catalytic domain [Saccharothrix sp. Mg75]|uniref:family 78 glycoside hydrolase catalytic domain n=1 Tax=Saccharothrix sp. Mg75 TaxID=3445357 RepID=UPI003EEA80C1
MVERTAVEYAQNLLGTDVAAPRLSWVLRPSVRQTAYQVVVSGVWDSGKVESDRTTGVPYGGPPLAPHTRYHWRVRVWDQRGRPSAWSAERWWETAFLGTPWDAEWIGAGDGEFPGLEAASWVWAHDGEFSPPGTRWFRAALDVPGAVARARVVATGDDDFVLHLNGEPVLWNEERVDAWKHGRGAVVTEHVRRAGGRVVLAAATTNRGDGPNPAGLIARLVVDLVDGTAHELVTGPGWLAADTEQPGWHEPGFDDSSWTPAAVLGPYGAPPWGDAVSVVVETPAPVLRREFRLAKPVASARLHLCGLAYHDAWLNGARVGDHVLDPGFTDYDVTVLHATHDVTRQLTTGVNALEVTLGRGFYGLTTPTAWGHEHATWRAEPKLLAQLLVTFRDGTKTSIGTGTGWRVADGPTRTDSLYAGESHDARHVPRDWRPAVVVDPPRGAVRAQAHQPVRVVGDVLPVSVAQPRPGVHVADFGRTSAGWTKLTVRAPAGTVVRLVHGEQLTDDGTVATGNALVPGRHQTDEYTCSGRGTETWEPRFSYKGFRYVEVTGLPRPPRRGELVCRVVHTDVPAIGSFGCSEPFFEQLERAMRRTLLNNLHGILTDTPTFEKNGWTGDVQLGAGVLMQAFAAERFLAKWLGDLADSQDEAGRLPVVVPTGRYGYADDAAPAPEWTTVYPYLVREFHRYYGDERVVADHWPGVVRYLDWEVARLEGGLATTRLGDYLPPGSGGLPPEDTRLSATAYLHRALLCAAEVGDLLGEHDTAAHYRSVADSCRDAVNAAFFDGARYRTGWNGRYSQTSNALALEFGLVPPGAEGAVAQGLADDVRARDDHLDTGALGTSVLLQALTRHGFPEVAHAVATQRTYPSWGFWFDLGADTMWEMWEEHSRSRDHFFKGGVVQWLYEHVAGLRPGDDGYRAFTIRPDARVGVTWARKTTTTVRGEASVEWSTRGPVLELVAVVPSGSTAEVHVPTGDPGAVTAQDGAEAAGEEPGFAVYRVGPGRWRFVSRL